MLNEKRRNLNVNIQFTIKHARNQRISESDSLIPAVHLPSLTTDQVRQWSEGFWIAGHLTQNSAPTVLAVQVEVVEKVVKAGETH